MASKLINHFHTFRANFLSHSSCYKWRHHRSRQWGSWKWGGFYLRSGCPFYVETIIIFLSYRLSRELLCSMLLLSRLYLCSYLQVVKYFHLWMKKATVKKEGCRTLTKREKPWFGKLCLRIRNLRFEKGYTSYDTLRTTMGSIKRNSVGMNVAKMILNSLRF